MEQQKDLSTSVYFRTETTKRQKFYSILALKSLSAKEVFNFFMDKFNKNPKETLEFLEL